MPSGEVGREEVRGGVLGHARERKEAIETGRERLVTYWKGIDRPGPKESSDSGFASQKFRVAAGAEEGRSVTVSSLVSLRS